MKRYKIEYWGGDRSKLHYFTELSKTGKNHGDSVWFYSNGTKMFQFSYKNNNQNGLYKFSGQSSYFFKNFKNGNEQGIRIIFNQSTTHSRQSR